MHMLTGPKLIASYQAYIIIESEISGVLLGIFFNKNMDTQILTNYLRTLVLVCNLDARKIFVP